ncbi:MAG TPA: hypothetical protein VIB62_09715 [Actinomycetota bacterium]|jgi:hypothetical protein
MDDSGGFGAAPPPPPPPSAGGGGQIAPKGVGDVYTTAWELYKTNASKLFTIVAIVVVPLSLLSALLTYVVLAGSKETTVILGEEVTVTTRSFGLTLLGSLLAAAIAIIISALLQAAIIRGAALASVGDPLDVEASYRYGFRRFGSVILVSLLVGLAVGIGLILLIIPGLILLVMFAVAIPALVVEDRRGTDAMSRSWNLVKGHFWHVVGVIVVGWLISVVVGLVFGAIGAAIGDLWVLRWIFDVIAQILIAPFIALVTVVLYIDLRARSEALTGDALRTELASNA